MKNYALFAALSLFSVFASANDQLNNQAPAAVDYNYSQNLDIAKVIQISSDNPNACGPVQAQMLYLDSKGVEHNLHYTRIGDGCENG
jgi:hypothetical protein